MKGVVESWDSSRGHGWIKPVFETGIVPKQPVSPKIEVERRVLSPSIAGTLRPGQQVGFVYRAAALPDTPGRAEAVVVISEPVPVGGVKSISPLRSVGK